MKNLIKSHGENCGTRFVTAFEHFVREVLERTSVFLIAQNLNGPFLGRSLILGPFPDGDASLRGGGMGCRNGSAIALRFGDQLIENGSKLLLGSLVLLDAAEIRKNIEDIREKPVAVCATRQGISFDVCQIIIQARVQVEINNPIFPIA